MAAGQWGPLDVLVLVLYFLGLAAVGLWASRRAQKAQKDHGASHDDYFLAERSVPYWAVAASLFASNIGAEHFVGLAGTAAYSGVAVAWYEWGAMPCLLALGFFFLPVYMRAQVTTMPDWVERRYGPFCRTFIVVVSLLLYVFTKISATLFAGDLIIQEISNINKLAATLVLIVGTALYTVTGGMAAVIYTEALQTAILVVGGLSLLGVGMFHVGGLPGLRERITHDPAYFHLFRSSSDETFPWTGYVFGYYFVSLWYWATDQVIVQRALAAKSIEHGQAGCVGGGLLKLLPGFIMVVPGMAARALMQERGVVAVDSDKQEFDKAFPWLVMNVMPKNTRGLIIAAMMSALMSSLASVFNSSATIFTMNVYARLRPRAPEAELVWTGRATVVAVAVLSILWLPLIPLFGEQLFLYIQKPPAFVAPPIFAIFLWGLLCRWVTNAGACWGLSIGVGVGMARFLLEIVDTVLGEHEGPLHSFVSFNFLHFAAVNFVFSSAIILGVSLAFPEDRQWGEEDQKVMWKRGLYEELMREEDQGAWTQLQGNAQAASGEEKEGIGFEHSVERRGGTGAPASYQQASAWTELELSAFSDDSDDEEGAGGGQGGEGREAGPGRGRKGKGKAGRSEAETLLAGGEIRSDEFIGALAPLDVMSLSGGGARVLDGKTMGPGDEARSLIGGVQEAHGAHVDTGSTVQDVEMQSHAHSTLHAGLGGACCKIGSLTGTPQRRKMIINAVGVLVAVCWLSVITAFR
eukprot:jgi/Mesen1/7991/ME000425S07187